LDIRSGYDKDHLFGRVCREAAQGFVMENASPLQFFIEEIAHLSIDSEIKELPSYSVCVGPDTPGRQVAEILENDTHLPGVLVVAGTDLVGVISRETFYEHAGRVFGRDIFLNRPIRLMLETGQPRPLVLPENLAITLATQQALDRDSQTIYQPIVIQQPDHTYRLISPLMLFIAQSQQLLELHNQRLYTVDAGQKISEREAITRFIRYAGNRPEFDLEMFRKRREVRCDHCSKMVHFSMVDLVRTFPQLNRGLMVEEKMGARMYRIYIRHTCAHNEVWEIPVQLDERLEYRSQRPARAVESYA
jgi:hypothetical protein